ncbi:porin [Paraburkholderia dokdonensis]|uniref:porin n=1 Tax=Paraburkholderia dokdonensis TaxID=2211211 RepID=UPI001D131D42|nr:porin [Paraburkholderia dokdonensis]
MGLGGSIQFSGIRFCLHAHITHHALFGAHVSNNSGGSHVYKMLSGANQNSRWGLKVREDLGGGLYALAQLENGFDVTSGAFQQGGRMFGRQAFVGLGDQRFGTLTLGRQYDEFWDYLSQMAPLTTNGLAAHPGDADNLMGSWRYNNSVKYSFPSIGGFNASVLYAFSNAAGAFNFNRAWSAGGSYTWSNIKIAAAYAELDRPGTANTAGAVTDDYAAAPFFLFRTSPINRSVGTERQRNYGVGSTVQFGKAGTWNVIVDQSSFRYLDGTSFRLTNFDTSYSYPINPALTVGAAYIFSMGRYGGAADSRAHWHTAQISLDYLLSKRTDIYVYDDFQAASGRYAVAAIYGNAPSTTSNQNLVMCGIRHRF